MIFQGMPVTANLSMTTGYVYTANTSKNTPRVTKEGDHNDRRSCVNCYL